MKDLWESTSQDTVDQYGKMVGQIEADTEVKKAQSQSNIDQLTAQKKMADDRANQKGFFGNLLDMVG